MEQLKMTRKNRQFLYQKQNKKPSISSEIVIGLIEERLKQLAPLSASCCIYKVPQRLRRLNPTAYTPKVVSIGPLHYPNKTLQVMEEYKYRYLQHFLDRTEENLEYYIRKVRRQEAELRAHYAEPIELSSDDFVTIILVDSAFIIELLCKIHLPKDPADGGDRGDRGDRIMRYTNLIDDISLDLMLLENQLPLFMLEDLYKSYNPEKVGGSEKLSIVQLFLKFNRVRLEEIGVNYDLVAVNSSEVKGVHFLDVIRELCLPPAKPDSVRSQVDSSEDKGVHFLDVTRELWLQPVEPSVKRRRDAADTFAPSIAYELLGSAPSITEALTVPCTEALTAPSIIEAVTEPSITVPHRAEVKVEVQSTRNTFAPSITDVPSTAPISSCMAEAFTAPSITEAFTTPSIIEAVTEPSITVPHRDEVKLEVQSTRSTFSPSIIEAVTEPSITVPHRDEVKLEVQSTRSTFSPSIIDVPSTALSISCMAESFTAPSITDDLTVPLSFASPSITDDLTVPLCFDSPSITDYLTVPLSFSSPSITEGIIEADIEPSIKGSPQDDKLKAQSTRNTSAPSITELHRAGVKFKKRHSTKNLFSILFQNGILEIPEVTISDASEITLRNLSAYEQCHYSNKRLSEYLGLLDSFVNTSKDVELLVKYGIVKNYLGDSSEACSLINSIGKGLYVNTHNSYFATLSGDLNKHCKRPWNEWKASLRQNYLYSPWAIVSVGAAVFLILLTIIQTVCSIVSLS